MTACARCRHPEVSLDHWTDLEWGEWSVDEGESPEAFAERRELSRAIQCGLNALLFDFFATAGRYENVAPCYGTHTLESYFRQLGG